MRSACFLDTNVLIYAATGRDDEPRKFAVAYDLVLQEQFGVSGQVLAEFYTAVQRKAASPPALAQIDEWMDRLGQHPFVPVDVALVRAGIFLSQRFRISYWDAAIIAAAERLGAETLYTEDLNHGQLYGSVRVVNPFREE
jgi:predicted nucleic acid-binding protein